VGRRSVANILEYIVEPVARGLRDASPYVRKTAVMCVLRLRDLSPETVVERRFVSQVVSLIDDRDPQVAANSVTHAPSHPAPLPRRRPAACSRHTRIGVH